MSKNNRLATPADGWSSIIKPVQNWNVSNLEGRILTLIESLGFDQKREAAVKSLFRNDLWEWWTNSIFPHPELQEMINKWFEDEQHKYPQPTATVTSSN